jgi:exodeoxyribonuclease VII small subunit
MATRSKQEDKLKFEEALERLETVVKEMESGELSLEKMMAHFEEGSQLVKFCGRQLDEVERKIEVLVKRDGDLVTEPFQTEAEEDREET